MSTLQQEINQVHERDLYFHFYGEAIAPAKTKYECDFISQYCAFSGHERILDLACGHGRHSIEFAQRGFGVHGVDINEAFIHQARNEAAQKGLSIRFELDDLLRLEAQSSFDAVLLLFNSLGFFNREDSQRIFNIISAALTPGGRAFIDCKNRDHICKEIKPYSVTEKGNDLMIDRLSFDPITGTTTNNRIYIKDSQRYEAPFTMYSYNYHDLACFAAAAGLKIIKTFGGWKGQPLDGDSRRIIIVLEK